MEDQKVWFITGASKGLGLALAKQLLNAGHKVAATSRNTAELTTAVGFSGNAFLPLQADLANEASVAAAIAQTHQVFGQINVVVNNAGYGMGGSIEELTDRETRDNFDINVFGTLNVIRQVMPILRKQQSGHIINIASVAGIAAATGWAIYGATKFAVIGLSEVLAQDVKSFGIHVTVVAPGAFRTSFLSQDSLVMTPNPIADYQDVRASHARYSGMDGQQAGDPEKAAQAMIHIATQPEPPLHLLLGSDAYNRAMTKVDLLADTYQQWKELTTSTDY
jgi:NAD(P)-dependent dehydrogenase (short-subunit alcohol dehydrogenase family)